MRQILKIIQTKYRNSEDLLDNVYDATYLRNVKSHTTAVKF